MNSDARLWYGLYQQRRKAWLGWFDKKPSTVSTLWIERERFLWRELEWARANFYLAAECETSEMLSEVAS